MIIHAAFRRITHEAGHCGEYLFNIHVEQV